MDMYQKRKMREEKKNNNNQESFPKVSISCPNIKSDSSYELTLDNHKITFINYIDVDKVYEDLFKKLGE